METGRKKEIKEFVRTRYSELARRGCSCSESAPSCCSDTKESYAKVIGYKDEDLKGMPDSIINTLAGCGNPTAHADLRLGETVLDLGAGGGIDAFLAARKVGAAGRVIGVDMTKDMVTLANRNKRKLNVKNVEFRLGEIEDLPVQDDSVDVIISNCVINLSPDKDKVFREAFRVLRPGGRMLVSDIVTSGKLPDEIRRDMEMWAGCVAGALEEGAYLQKVIDAGFADVQVVSKRDFRGVASSLRLRAIKPRNRTAAR